MPPFRAAAAFLALAFLGGTARAEPVRILAFGDSLTAGYGLQPAEAFPPVLAQRLHSDGYDVVIANAGVAGDTTQMGLDRLAPALATKPDLVILELGGNDMLNGISPKITKANLEKIIRGAKAGGARVLLAGMIAVMDKLSEADRRRFNAVFPALAKKHALPLYPFFLAGVVGNPDLVLWGGLHPTREGVRVIVNGIAPLVERALNEMGAKRR